MGCVVNEDEGARRCFEGVYDVFGDEGVANEGC